VTPPRDTLQDSLVRRIRHHGGLSLADYMAEVLTHPERGYYSGGDPFGAQGDFITAPEISQMFGELVGLWCGDSWRRLGAPRPIALVELGPGRGTLLADALRALRLLPDFLEACELHLVEASPFLKARQAAALKTAAAELTPRWHGSLGEVPDGPMIIVANEFFDALPIRQFERTGDGWCERLVVLDPDAGPTGPAFRFALSPPRHAAAVPLELRDAAAGSLVEVSFAGISIAAEIGRRLAAHPGAALIIDYGHDRPRTGGTFQALRKHAAHDPLADPGSADLTAHVDFAALARAACQAGASAHGPLGQGAFLEGLGIAARAEALCQGATAGQAEQIESARSRLTDPDQMGELFRVLALTSPGMATPAGFA
jgi:NADH dehydrogenase [ubiquinone] 1 alpha subcomplex assembly factor 7